MLFRSVPHMPNTCILAYVSGSKRVKIPWAKISADLTSWIEPECVPDGFQWADPSKIRVGDIFPLFAHWRERQRQHLSPLIWVETCPLLRNASPSFEDRQRYHSDELTGSESSDDDSPVQTSPESRTNSDNTRSDYILYFDPSCSDPHILYHFRPISEQSEDRYPDEWGGIDDTPMRPPSPHSESHDSHEDIGAVYEP